MMSNRTFNVLFLCTGNSARSILSEVVLNKKGAGRFRAFSAGSQPTGAVNPGAIELLKEMRFPIEGLRSKSWDEFARPDSPKMDFVITVCDRAAAESCPIWSGAPLTAHWGVPDPAAVADEKSRKLAFREALRLISQRIDIFLSLPFDSVNELAMRNKLRAIGTDIE
ncbi:MAG TPA: arsenate reductase ArsC [Steroidobacteraceae bacterium]|nr:arsenate reductase ArsC [Steroidobacteraceae bacterium]